MKRISVILIILIYFVLSPVLWAQNDPNKMKAEEKIPEIIAVKFHADWCGYCKAMGSVFEEMQAKYDNLPVLYIVLDQTRDFNRKQSEYLAASLGINDIWAENAGKTGFILLINGKTHEIIGKFTHDQTLKQIGETLMNAVKKG